MELNWRLEQCVKMLVTPIIAQLWIDSHNAYNRKVRWARVAQYERDILAKHWLFNHQGFAFDWNGQLIDGQHRLLAIIRTGQSMESLVTTGLDPLVRENVDNHARRDVGDAFMFSGREDRLGGGGRNNTAAGMWARMMHGLTTAKGTETRAELLAFSDRYADGGKWALETMGQHSKQRGIYIAPVLAAIACAYYNVTHRERLARFCEVLSSGIMRTPTDATAVYLRNMLVGEGRKGRNSNQAGEVYGKTCRAIQAFMRDEIVQKFYQPAEDPYPLPDWPPSATDPRADRMVGNMRREDTGRSSADLLAAVAR